MKKQYLYAPGSDLDWEVWAFTGTGESKDPIREQILSDGALATSPPPQVVVALPISQCLLLPIWLTTSNETLHRQMIVAQLEKRGLPTRNGLIFDFCTIAKSGNRTLLAVTILPPDFPEALTVPRARSYVCAPAILPLPENQIVLWQERGQVVLAVTRGSEPAYAQVLRRKASGFHFTDSVVQEIRNIQISLELEQVVEAVEGITLLGEWPGAKEQLGGLRLPVIFAPRPSPTAHRFQTITARSSLLPLPLQNARVTRSRRDRNIQLAIAAAVGYVLILLMLFLYVHSVQAKAAKLMASVIRDKPVADVLAKTVASWRAMEPAINPRLYAIEQFFQCTSELPGAGVRFDTFETQGTTIRVNGTARNAPTVFRFVERLKANKSLSDYQWKLGQPKLQKDDTAVFKLEGTLRYGPPK